ncbi:MAG: methyl-accepting chemotaxis protein [Pirellulaceae bacterium]|nr:methyl-accepting chemotaxis protein [Pirellulaceae bacterium]
MITSNTLSPNTYLTSATPEILPGKPATSARKGSIESLVDELALAVESAVGKIRTVNSSTRTLALNARIEAARAGQYGAAFGVVASEMQDLSSRTTEVADLLATTTNVKINELLGLIGNNIRGTRLSDLALTNIDLIDRCLYERTCDVRWWATDSSLTEAMQSQTSEALVHASRRMGVILNAYTVYYDLVLCDLHGRVVANGRPDRFHSVGKSCAGNTWFTSAMGTYSGDQFGFQSAHMSDLVEGRPSLIYSCTVREGGNAQGQVLGVLGVIFNWSSLAEPILRNLPIAAEERAHTECLIVDASGHILASHLGCDHNSMLHLAEFNRVLSESKGYFTADYQGRPCCIAHAKAPGFETYSTDWYSLIIQPT